MLKTAIVAFATFFATIGPLDLAAFLAALTPFHTAEHRRAIAFKGVIVAAVILLLFAFFGTALLHYLGISLPALRIAGGVLLLLLAIDMVFGGETGGKRSTVEEALEARQKEDISVFPIATPLIAGPASMSATVLLMAGTKGDIFLQAAVIIALIAVLAVTLLLLVLSIQIQRLLGVTSLHVVSRTAGVVLSALAVQFMLEGLSESGLFH
jgi:multiple antibiotic resistance protein